MSDTDGLDTDRLLVQTSGTTPTLQDLSGEWDYYSNPAPGFGPGPDEDDEDDDAGEKSD